MSKWTIWHRISDSNAMHYVSEYVNESSAYVALHLISHALGTFVTLDDEFQEYVGLNAMDVPVWAWCVVDRSGNKFFIMEDEL